MSFRIASLLVPLLFLVGCSSDSLTTEECETIITGFDKMAENMAANEKDLARVRKTLRPLHEGAVRNCAAGNSLSREDLKCVTEAWSDDRMKVCFDAARERFNKQRGG
ncbi:hypothetical protein [Arenimonas sp.]|uniref:hypothetical protein n=1 Tax=Arenimonas sp. TaxID=1872635 RepID=UPI0039E60519